MRNRSARGVLALLVVFVAACGSTAAITEPAFQIRVLQVPENLPQSNEGFGTVVTIEAANRSSNVMTLQRIQVTSVGEGRFTVQPASENFQRDLEPGEAGSFPVRVNVVARETIGKSDEPLYVRAIITFELNDQSYRRTIMQRINPSSIEPWG